MHASNSWRISTHTRSTKYNAAKPTASIQPFKTSKRGDTQNAAKLTFRSSNQNASWGRTFWRMTERTRRVASCMPPVDLDPARASASSMKMIAPPSSSHASKTALSLFSDSPYHLDIMFSTGTWTIGRSDLIPSKGTH